MLLRPQVGARSLSHTVSRLRRNASTRTGQNSTRGEIPRALMATTSFAPDIRENAVVQASNSVMGIVNRKESMST